MKKQNKIIAGIGAATKGNTLLNYCNLTSKQIDFILDKSKLKIGKYTPGSCIKIVDEDHCKNFHALIFGLIIPKNQLPILVSLRENAFKSFPEILFSVVAVHDNANKWNFRHAHTKQSIVLLSPLSNEITGSHCSIFFALEIFAYKDMFSPGR